MVVDILIALEESDMLRRCKKRVPRQPDPRGPALGLSWLNNLTQTSRHLHATLTPTLYSRGTVHKRCWELKYHGSYARDPGDFISGVHFAASLGCTPAFALFLQHAPHPAAELLNRHSEFRLASPLHYAAAFAPTSDIVKYLLDTGANAQAQDALGNTALMALASYRVSQSPHEIKTKTEIVSFLLAAGCPMTHSNKYGTALHLAAGFGNDDVLKTLISSSPSKEFINHKATHKSHTALHRAIWFYKSNAASEFYDSDEDEMSLDEHVDVPEEYWRPDESSLPAKSDGARMLLDAGIDINALAGRHGRTALCEALNHDINNYDLVKLLLERGARVWWQPEDGHEITNCFVDLCTWEDGFFKITTTQDFVSLLLKYMTPEELEAKELGQTALVAAIRFGEVKTVRKLIAAGASLDATMNDGTSVREVLEGKSWLDPGFGWRTWYEEDEMVSDGDNYEEEEEEEESMLEEEE
jgi:ankyrin repeat protein